MGDETKERRWKRWDGTQEKGSKWWGKVEKVKGNTREGMKMMSRRGIGEIEHKKTGLKWWVDIEIVRWNT